MIRKAALIVAAYVAITVIMTWPYFSYQNVSSASYGGDARLIIWTLAWDNHALLSRLPLFQSNVFFPSPDSLRYNEHLFGVSLFTLPWAAAGASPVLAYNVTWWLAWPLNGIATFTLLRRHVADSAAAFAGSLAFICSFYVMLHAHGHLHLIWLWPVPLSMFLVERWFDNPRWPPLIAWLTVFLLGSLTSWYLAVMMLIANAVTGVTIAASIDGRALRWRPHLLQLIAAAAIVGLVLFPFARHYMGMRGAPGEAEANAATVTSYVVPPENTVLGKWWTANVDQRPRPIYGERTLYAGWITLALALAGAIVLVRRDPAARRMWVFPVLAVVGFLISLGPSPGLPGGSTLAPFAWLSALPGFEGMRAPARFGAVTMLGIAGLTALGASTVSRAVAGRAGAVLVLVPFMLAEWFVVDFPARKPMPSQVPAIYLTDEVRAARSLVSLPEYFGTSDWVLGGDYLYYSMWHWRPIVNGFGRSAPPDYSDLITQVRDFPNHAPALRALGLQFVVLHADRYPNHGTVILGAAEASGCCRLVRRIGNDYLFSLGES